MIEKLSHQMFYRCNRLIKTILTIPHRPACEFHALFCGLGYTRVLRPLATRKADLKLTKKDHGVQLESSWWAYFDSRAKIFADWLFIDWRVVAQYTFVAGRYFHVLSCCFEYFLWMWQLFLFMLNLSALPCAARKMSHTILIAISTCKQMLQK